MLSQEIAQAQCVPESQGSLILIKYKSTNTEPLVSAEKTKGKREARS